MKPKKLILHVKKRGAVEEGNRNQYMTDNFKITALLRNIAEPLFIV